MITDGFYSIHLFQQRLNELDEVIRKVLISNKYIISIDLSMYETFWLVS